MKPSAKVTDYGLVFGAADVEGAAPTYVYFTIAQDGTFQVRQRTGDQVNDIERSLHFAIRKPDASGKSTNTLEVQVAPTAVSYLINDAVVHATPTRAGTGAFTEGEKTNGLVGIRIDGDIDLQVDAFELKSPFTPPQRGQ
jgi:methionine aminopeptidase